MSIKKYREILGWCTVINFGLFFLTVLMFLLAGDRMFEFHNQWFRLSAETYNSIWFLTISIWKTLVIVFNLIPYIVLRIVDKN
jgi:uncharacterized protein DUF6868